MAALNWTYGAASPDVETAVDEAIGAAHRYRNKLCELELAKRERHEELLQRLAPDYVAACAAVERAETRLGEVRERIQRERKLQGTKTPAGCERLAAEAKQIKADLKLLRAARKAAKQAAYARPDVAAAMDENQSTWKAEWRQAKADSGLYWGTEAIVKQACGSFSSGAPPRFRRFDGTGQIAVQLQKGLDCRQATGPDTRLQLLLPDELEAALATDGKVRPRLQRTAECLFRIGSDGGAPVFARVPLTFHRALPAGKIKWAYLERRRIADQVRWKLRLTIDVPAAPLRPMTRPAVAVHVGWRMDGDDLRVATWRGGDGKLGRLRLPARHLADYARIDAVLSERIRAFNARLERLRSFLKSAAVPDWLREATQTIGQWRSPRRLAGLVWKWKGLPFEGDEEIFADLEGWRKWDKRKWQHERWLSVKIVRRRSDLYRNFAARLHAAYDVAYIAPIQAKKLVERSDPEELDRDVNARRAKQAAVSDLLRIVREKFGLRCVETPAAGITLLCSRCGTQNAAPRRRVQCGGCGRTYDRDDNAVENTLARGAAAVETGALLANERAQQLAAEKRLEKLQKMQAANRAAREAERKSRARQEVGAN